MNTPPPLCAHCNSACCRQSIWPFAVELTSDDLQRPDLRKASVRNKHSPFRVLPYRSGKCPFLDGTTDRCRIYNHRPQRCRDFSCLDCRPTGPFFNENPVVAAMVAQTLRTTTPTIPHLPTPAD